MAAAVAHVHRWDHHDACLFAISGSVDPSGASVPTIEKINEFHYNLAHGNFATLICEGTHNAPSAQVLSHALMAPGRQWNLFICRYDAQPNFTAANGAEYRVRHTVHNLRARICGFQELQTQITIHHETGHTEIKKVMKFVFENVSPMEATVESTYLSTLSTLSTASASTIISTTAWTPEVSTLATLSAVHVSTLTGTS